MTGIPGNPQVLRVVLLGIDGAGKTTVARTLMRELATRGVEAELYRNPGGRRTLNRWASRYSATAESLLGVRVLDALETMLRILAVLRSTFRARRRRGVVVFDRHLHCQLALRKVRGLSAGRLLRWLMKLLPQPDLVIYLSVEPHAAYARIASRATDEETLEFLASLDAAYRSLPDFGTFVVLDGNGSLEDTSKKVVTQVLSAVVPAISSARASEAG
ncbi:dTMP kinase [Arthrobacter tecti]